MFTVVTNAVDASGAPPANGTGMIWKVDLGEFDASGDFNVTFVANVTGSGFLNGLSVVGGGSNKVLVADATMGLIWGIDAETGEVG